MGPDGIRTGESVATRVERVQASFGVVGRGSRVRHLAMLCTAPLLWLLFGDAVLSALALLYVVVDVAALAGARRIARAAAVPPERKLAGLLTLHVLSVASFAVIPICVILQDTPVAALAGYMLACAHAIHVIGANARSRDMLLIDVVAIASYTLLTAALGLSWTDDASRLALFVGLALLLVHFAVAAAAAHRVQTDLARTSDRLRRAERSGVVGMLAGGIAHDFNNLLTVVRGNAELMRQVPEGERGVLLDEIEAAARSGGELVSHLSAAGRPARDGDAEAAEVGPSLDRVARMGRRLLPANVALELDAQAAPARVRVDPARLELALLNLIANARDALPSGGRIDLRAGRADGAMLCLEVIDDGHGMTPEEAAVAADPYVTTKAAGEGTGLGLAMVRALADAAGGRLDIRSAPGRGTAVRLTLPADDRAPPAPAALDPRPGRP